jgi:hypothetical protein
MKDKQFSVVRWRHKEEELIAICIFGKRTEWEDDPNYCEVMDSIETFNVDEMIRYIMILDYFGFMNKENKREIRKWIKIKQEMSNILNDIDRKAYNYPYMEDKDDPGLQEDFLINISLDSFWRLNELDKGSIFEFLGRKGFCF